MDFIKIIGSTLFNIIFHVRIDVATFYIQFLFRDVNK